LFPRVQDQHKEGKPLIPNGLGVLYVLFTTVYLFALYFSGIVKPVNGVSAPLTLAVCILFGGFMGLLDDWMDLRWRYKAFMPLIAALPLVYFAQVYPLRTTITLPFDGRIDFGNIYYLILIPLIVMIVTNTVNMLGGLNGLESVCPVIVLISLLGMSELTNPIFTFMIVPILFWLILSVLNVQGKIFVGNSGSFAIGMTIASFAIVADVKLGLLLSILPFVFNSALILLTVFFIRKKAVVAFDGKKLVSDHRRSLVTLITYRRPLTERKVVALISVIFLVFSVLAVLAETLSAI
jgi:UDP-N-acetylglucosamine--dolichyl-phosphate N-acetylglucosaminephosphotransferase